MKKTRLVVIGGFLGAGKTTFISSMAKYLANNLKKVGIVTNDQGTGLVDTNYLRSEGFTVMEVAGGGFCCNFNEFVEKAESLAENDAPDIILAEPVGSCTDLAATLFRPLQEKLALRFELSPICIIADPDRIREFLMKEKRSLFPDEISYLFTKQLEEADLIILNKVDKLDKNEEDGLIGFLRERFPGTAVISVCSNSIKNVGCLVPFIIGSKAPNKEALEIDYGIYGRAEEKLGWLNYGGVFKSSEKINWNSFIVEIMEGIKKEMAEASGEIAHLKIYAVADDDFAKAGLTSLEEDICFNCRIMAPTDIIGLLINARIGIEPARLAAAVEDVLCRICGKWEVFKGNLQIECFNPGWPKPKYKMTV